MTKINSFDFTLQKRQVVELFDVYLKEKSSALSLFMANGRGKMAGTNNKYEWLESQLTPKAWTINGQITAWTLNPVTPANLTFTSTTWLAVDDIVRFENGTTRAPIWDLQVKIVSITNGTVATWVIYGWTTDITIPTWAVAKFMTNLVPENKKVFVWQNDWEPETQYNNFQIFDQTVELSRTALNSAMYGNPSQLASQLKQAFYKFEQKLSEQMIYGRRVARNGNEKGTFAWMLFYNKQAWGNIKDASAGALTSVLINDVIEQIKKDGGSVNTIMCNYEQARRISAFNTSGNNPMISRSETTTGSYVMQFVSDIPVAWGLVSSIIIDEKMPVNEVHLIDTSKYALVPYAEWDMSLVDGTLPGQDWKTQILRWEYTLMAQDCKYSAWVITNLAI